MELFLTYTDARALKSAGAFPLAAMLDQALRESWMRPYMFTSLQNSSNYFPTISSKQQLQHSTNLMTILGLWVFLKNKTVSLSPLRLPAALALVFGGGGGGREAARQNCMQERPNSSQWYQLQCESLYPFCLFFCKITAGTKSPAAWSLALSYQSDWNVFIQLKAQFTLTESLSVWKTSLRSRTLVL